MASTYSNLKIQLMATGENSGTWGNVTNVNLGTAIEQAMVESATVTFSSANVTLTLTDTNAAQNARALRLNLTGTTGGARDLIVPAIQKPYIVNNGTADTITVKVSGQTGIAVPASKTMLVYNNGTDVVNAINHLSALSLGTALPIASGGTGSTSTTYANLESNVTGTLPVANGGTGAATLTSEAVVIGNTTGAVKFVSPGTDGNVLTSNGTAWVSEAPVVPEGVPTGSIMEFVGDPGAGWLECNGQVVSQSTYSTLYSKVGLLKDGFNTTSYLNLSNSFNDTNTSYRISEGAYGNSTYVLPLYHDSDPFAKGLHTSTDAITWTARSNAWVAGFQYAINLLYTDKFVMSAYVTSTGLSNRNYFFTSTDGITWTARTGASSSGGYISSLMYENSIYVAINDGQGVNSIQTSTDAITWTQRTLAVSIGSSGFVAYGNSVFVLLSHGPSPDFYQSLVQTSTDAITWTYRTVLTENMSYPLSLQFVNDKFYAVGSQNYTGQVSVVFTSTDGITWSRATSLMSQLDAVNSLVYDNTNSLIYAAGCRGGDNDGGNARNAIAISGDNGVTWEVRPIGAIVSSTVTTGGVSTVMSPGRGPNFNSPKGIYINNNKIFYGNSMITMRLDSAGALTKPLVQKIDSLYTYQTDTQFVLPTISRGNIGVYTVTQSVNTALSPAVVGKNVKYYIKT